MTIAEFFYMEGHGFYVWSSYGLGLIAFATLYFSTRMTTQRLANQLKRQFRMQDHSKDSNIMEGE